MHKKKNNNNKLSIKQTYRIVAIKIKMYIPKQFCQNKKICETCANKSIGSLVEYIKGVKSMKK